MEMRGQEPEKTHSRSASPAAVLSFQPRSPCSGTPKPVDRVWKLRTGGSSRSSPAPALASPSSLCLERVSLGLLCRHKHGLGKTGRRYSWDRWCTALVSWETVLRVKLLSGLQRSCGRLLRRCGSRCVRRSSWRWHRRCSC